MLRARVSVRDWDDNAASIGSRPSTTQDDPSEMLTAKEVAAMLKISPKTIYRYTAEGKIPYCKFESNVRFTRREILFWIEEHKYQPHAHGRRPRSREVY